MSKYKILKCGNYFDFEYDKLNEALGILLETVAYAAQKIPGKPQSAWVKIDKYELEPEKACLQWCIEYKTKKEAGA